MAFMLRGDAALGSLRASLAPVENCGEEDPAESPSGDSDGEDGVQASRSQLALVEPRTGPTPKRRSSNARSGSRSDPDAKLRGKPGQRPHLVHRAQIAVDAQARCIVACRGETADGHEGDALAPIIPRARFACPDLESVAADQGFAGEQVCKDVAALGVIAYVPPQRTMLPPAGQQPKTDAKREALAARQRCKTPTGTWAHRRRMSDAEGGVAELKNEHAMARARCRGTKLFHVQLLLGCSALNVKRLITRPDAARGQPAGPATAQAAEEAAGSAIGATGRVPNDRSNARTGSPSSALLTAAAWTISLSMN